jgi:hypothetical protein
MARTQKVTPQVGMKVKVIRDTSHHYQPIGAIVTISGFDPVISWWVDIDDSRTGRSNNKFHCKISDLSFRKFKQR